MNEVIFGSTRSYTNLGMMLTDVDISIPEPKRTLIDVPGRDGMLDLTYSLSSEITYKNRKIILDFAMADYQRRWISLFSDIVKAIHGKKQHVVIEPDTGYYWDAFCTVDTAKCDRNKGTIRIVLDAFPYKYKASETSYTVRAAYGGMVQACAVTGMKVQPSFQASGSGCSVRFGQVTHNLSTGAAQSFKDIIFTEGTNEIFVTGNSTNVTITYREAIL